MLSTLSINIYSNELNLKGGGNLFGKAKSDYVEEVWNGHGNRKNILNPGLTLGLNYLFNLKKIDLLIGPYINFSIKNVKSIVNEKFSATSFGIMSKKYIDKNIYFLGGLGLNTLYETGTAKFSISKGDLLVDTSTTGGSSYFIGGGYKIHDKLSLELLYQHLSGKLLHSGINEYGRYSHRDDITIDSVEIALNYQLKLLK